MSVEQNETPPPSLTSSFHFLLTIAREPWCPGISFSPLSLLFLHVLSFRNLGVTFVFSSVSSNSPLPGYADFTCWSFSTRSPREPPIPFLKASLITHFSQCLFFFFFNNNLIEIYFTYDKNHPFKMQFNGFNIFTEMCNHHHYLN